MRTSIVFFALGFSCTLLAQVGINTTNPQQSVHVAGSTSNVRIDGLNESNNTENLGINSTTRVYVDGEGDLVLGSESDNVQMLVDSENYLNNVENPTSLVNQTGTAFGYEIAGYPTDFAGSTFTLTKNAIVEVNYSVSYSLYKTSGASGRIDDQHARIVQTGLYFREVTDPTDPYAGPAVINDLDGIPINGGPWCIDVNASGTVCLETGGLLALNGQFYANNSNRNGEYKNFWNTGTDYVKLPPGTYVALFAAQLAVGNVSGTGAVKMYLGSGADEMQIIAHYYD
ncbi:hypothetical protein J1N09_12435 [Aureitalea sp. L0-47]|uniref:hypothetical protein n=1 Tax=Aureitalea sp. L0-47 TaxID=2816962 RepID=UPI0022373C99|nr:hypothetical protein [Aureitalea sp. L0-47]MCW5520653.1 hypothetical protein [Aureitalea sp. L0-47]